jgi:Fuc2NAc and GlcNAc transferase
MSVSLPVLASVVLAAFGLAAAGTGWVRGYAVRRALIDIPGERSSHTVPTPRGGGLAIAVVTLLSIILLGLTGLFTVQETLAMAGGGMLVAAVGWREDHSPIAAHWRGLAYLAAVAWALYWLDGLDSLRIGGELIALGWPGMLAALFGMAWLTNLYNFMDGTDALAATQAVTASLAAGFLLWQGEAAGPAILALVIAAAASGFLCWNWPPARIFMGDVGSCLLGFLFAVLALIGERHGTVPVLLWVILLGGFIWDATLTLCMRVVRGERWYAAHRSHAYQRLVQLGWSHRRLALAFLALNLLVLWPLAWLAASQPPLAPYATAISAAICALIWLGIQMYHRRAIETGEGT